MYYRVAEKQQRCVDCGVYVCGLLLLPKQGQAICKSCYTERAIRKAQMEAQGLSYDHRHPYVYTCGACRHTLTWDDAAEGYYDAGDSSPNPRSLCKTCFDLDVMGNHRRNCKTERETDNLVQAGMFGGLVLATVFPPVGLAIAATSGLVAWTRRKPKPPTGKTP